MEAIVPSIKVAAGEVPGDEVFLDRELVFRPLPELKIL
jgi:hypothetical protein